MATNEQNITKLLINWSNGDKEALDELLPLVYQELRRLAGHFLRNEKGGHMLQATALVHEAYLKLIDQNISWQNRAHFFAIAAKMMRRIMVDHARSLATAKRGGDRTLLTLDENLVAATNSRNLDLLALDQALTELSKIDARQGQIIEMRFFGGLTIEETAEILNLSPATVKREWVMARAWLYKTIEKQQL